MSLKLRLKRLENERQGLPIVVVTRDQETIRTANVTRWDGQQLKLFRRAGESVESFLTRANMLAGDLASIQAYVLSELRLAHSLDHVQSQ
jgi:hypothetical protein